MSSVDGAQSPPSCTLLSDRERGIMRELEGVILIKVKFAAWLMEGSGDREGEGSGVETGVILLETDNQISPEGRLRRANLLWDELSHASL